MRPTREGLQFLIFRGDRRRARGTALLPLLLAALLPAMPTGARAQTVAAGSFETPDVSPSFQMNPVVTDAVFTGNSGIAHNVAFNFTAPGGDQAGFVQSTGTSASIALTARNLAVGTSYRVRFMIAKRYSFGANQLTVAFNGAALGTFSTTSESFVQFVTNSFTPTATTGQITITGATVPNTSTLIDLVAVVPASGAEVVKYKYDALGRLVEESTAGTVNDGVKTQVCYDRAGNRSSYAVTGVGGTTPPLPACP
jgi:YD repeat-containing protein